MQSIVSRIQVFWNVWLWSEFPDISNKCSALIIRTKHPEIEGAAVLCGWETLAQLQMWHIPEDLNLQGHRCENVKLIVYSDTLANEDNSFRNHIR
jgi:hypothetical protein